MLGRDQQIGQYGRGWPPCQGREAGSGGRAVCPSLRPVPAIGWRARTLSGARCAKCWARSRAGVIPSMPSGPTARTCRSRPEWPSTGWRAGCRSGLPAWRGPAVAGPWRCASDARRYASTLLSHSTRYWAPAPWASLVHRGMRKASICSSSIQGGLTITMPEPFMPQSGV